MGRLRTAAPLRFTDGDSLRAPHGATWRRGLRTPGVWEEFPAAGQAGPRTDDEARALLTREEEGWLLVPFLPPVTAPLPGTACTSAQQVRDLLLAPASGAVLYTARLGRTQSFLGDDRGAFHDVAHPVRLRPSDLRATLEGVLTRRASAKVTYHRFSGRAYARYATGSTLHTHIHLLTR
ncbi:hypothetical protein [Streptomyces nanshensis]|uniref:Uncharacterized protein n=1 Tax=Streptomyces nanshensis TaxID=518642 RepID=A0A1E7KZ62_9ACTN|nr:hypothetical protein [Streptomyces nanshensis]OEV09204.1 hypothetical protein AN218_22260 [Streptomyces nanshensis]